MHALICTHKQLIGASLWQASLAMWRASSQVRLVVLGTRGGVETTSVVQYGIRGPPVSSAGRASSGMPAQNCMTGMASTILGNAVQLSKFSTLVLGRAAEGLLTPSALLTTSAFRKAHILCSIIAPYDVRKQG